jgi:hypothetical protein
MATHTEISAPSSVYFAEDGSYGSASLVILADVSSWGERDWQMIEEASDAERPHVARIIAQRKYEESRKK